MNDTPSSREFRFRDAREERIFRRLRQLVGEGAARFFRDACKLEWETPPLETASHMAGHALREAESSIRRVLDPGDTRSRSSEGHANSIHRVCTGLGIAADDPLRTMWLGFSGRDNQEAFYWRAHRDDLALPRPIDAGFHEWARRVKVVFDEILSQAEAKYSFVFKKLDDLLSTANPTAADVARFKTTIPHTALAHLYFFKRLEHPGWLRPLMDVGVLNRIVPLERNEVEGTIAFPPWPVAPFLLRMAKSADRVVQTDVHRVLTTLPDTDNTLVHTEVAEIANSLPPDLGKDVIPFLERGLKHPYHQMLLPGRLSSLIERLAKSGHVDSVLGITRTMFELLPDPSPPREFGGTAFPPSPVARLRSVFYEQELAKVVGALIDADPWKASKLFAELIDGAIRLSRRDEAADAQSYTQIWLPTLRGGDPNLRRPQEHLILALVDAAEAASRRDPARLVELLTDLAQYKWLLFRRVGLHLLTSVAATHATLADAAVLQVTDYDEPELRTEYGALLRQRFPGLATADQQRILAHLMSTRDSDAHRADLEQWLGRSVSHAEVEKDLRRRQYHNLRVLDGLLPADVQELYLKLANEFEQEERAEEAAQQRARQHLKTTEELLALPDAELVAYLQGAELGHEPFGPSMEGLGQALGQAAAQEPERLSRLADRLQVDPSLVTGLLRGFEAPVKAKAPLSWESILRLCQWVVDQPRAITGRKTRYADLDPGWVWTRKQIADLLAQGLNAKSIPLEYRSAVWSVLSTLLTDPDPSPEREETNDPLTTAINSVRGEALYCVLAYSFWLRKANPSWTTFENMPEVRTALEQHLDPGVDPSPAIRAVYGRHLRLLLYLDQVWTQAAVPLIFPEAADQLALRRAAWQSYVVYGEPAPFSYLEAQYRHAIEELRHETTTARSGQLAEQQLAQQLMILAWQGLIPIDDPAGHVQLFFKRASASLRNGAIQFIGNALRDTDGLVPGEVLARLRALWEWRIREARSGDPSQFEDELAAFSWWFASRKLDPLWALAQLREVLELTGRIDFEDQVMEVLAELCSAHPRACVEIVDLLLRGSGFEWGLGPSESEMRTILEAAKHSSDQDAKRLVQDVVNRLEARGIHGFRGLL